MFFFYSFIFFFIFSSNLFSYFFWEVLGIYSFFLISWYFNQDSLVSSFKSLITSKFSDFLFLFLMLSFFILYFKNVLFVKVFVHSLVFANLHNFYFLVDYLLQYLLLSCFVFIALISLVAAGVIFFFKINFCSFLFFKCFIVQFYVNNSSLF
jgi:NADH:ubiquinone oxidoreductase subunit 5 (subunit L)/multisubunit Na+/H+ antiporter MnhA subunit